MNIFEWLDLLMMGGLMGFVIYTGLSAYATLTKDDKNDMD